MRRGPVRSGPLCHPLAQLTPPSTIPTPTTLISEPPSVLVFPEDCRCIDGIVRAEAAHVRHDHGYAEIVERIHIDWHKPERAIATLQGEFRRAAQRCLANKR